MSEKNKISAVDRRRKKVAIHCSKHYWDKCTYYNSKPSRATDLIRQPVT